MSETTSPEPMCVALRNEEGAISGDSFKDLSCFAEMKFGHW